MSPEIYTSGYEIEFHLLKGEVEEEHRSAKMFTAVANDFLRGFNRRQKAKGFFMRNSAVTALANFLPKNIAERFVQDVLDGRFKTIRFTRGQDSPGPGYDKIE